MDDANEILEFDIRRNDTDGTNEDILPTQIAQPAILLYLQCILRNLNKWKKVSNAVAVIV